MNDFKSKLKEENENVKELFNFNGDEAQLTHIKEIIKHSSNGSNYFLKFLEHYSLCRPHQHSVSRELVECLYSCFPEQINEIQQKIKKKSFLKFIIFPEKFPIKDGTTKGNVFASSKR